MDTTTTKPAISASFLFNLDRQKAFFNDNISFFCVIWGNVHAHYGGFNGDMTNGDFFLMKESGQCELSCSETALCLLIVFDYLYFIEEFAGDFELLQCNSVQYPAPCNNNIFSALIRLSITHTMDPETNRFLVLHQIYNVFHLLEAHCVRKQVSPSSQSRQDAKLSKFISWMKENHMTSITLQDAADYMDYTPQYLSSFIKKHLGKTFNSCLNQFRLESACNYLKFRDFSIEQISFLCGFANPASFRKIFMTRYLTTPEQYRKNHRDSFRNNFKSFNLFTNPSYIRDCLTSILKTGSSASPAAIEPSDSLTIVYNVNDTRPLRATWQELINLGTAQNFEMPIFREHLSLMQADLHFRYGRVTNVLSIVSTYYSKGKSYVFNFSRVFEIIDFILKLKMKPLLDLGDKSPDIFLPQGNITIGNPEALDHIYSEMIPQLLRACVNHYGYEEVSTWKFELWMRYSNPDLSKVESPSDYFRRFEKIYRAVKRIVPEAMVGGPGYNTFTPTEHLDRTLDYLHKQGLHPDFISVYIFLFKTPHVLTGSHDTSIILDENPDFFQERISRIREVCNRNHMKKLPLYVTEYSTYIAYKNVFNDSMYLASFILKQCLDNWNQVDAMGYFLATDYANEYPGTNKFLFGGNGIINRTGIKKPGYHAFAFLSMLGNRLVARNRNYIVTSSDNDRYQIIIYNYAHFIPHFCHDPSQYDIEKYPETALENVPPFQLDLSLTGLSSGSYKISHYLVSLDHGFVFHDWIKLDTVPNLNDTELRYLKNSCIPSMTITTKQITDTLTIQENINRNEICFISIEKIY